MLTTSRLASGFSNLWFQFRVRQNADKTKRNNQKWRTQMPLMLTNNIQWCKQHTITAKRTSAPLPVSCG